MYQVFSRAEEAFRHSEGRAPSVAELLEDVVDLCHRNGIDPSEEEMHAWKEALERAGKDNTALQHESHGHSHAHCHGGFSS